MATLGDKEIKFFPEGTKFQFPWRPYQARILQELETHLDDNRLHVVAAPGSGKTILGLEVVRRINQPTLILAPTIAIRDQWVTRLIDFFLPEEHKEPDWISKDIREPKFLTVSTYQGLHMAYTGDLEDLEEFDEDPANDDEDDSEDENNSTISSNKMSELIENLQTTGIKTVVVDEAHHLRAKWWWTLTDVLDRLGSPKILALTATPP